MKILTMKKNRFISLCFILILVSCSKNYESSILEKRVNTVEKEFIKGVSVKNGTLHFDSEDTFFDLADQIANMGNEDFNDRSLCIGFNSYRTKFHNEEVEYEKEVNRIVEEAYLNNVEPTISVEKPSPDILSNVYRSIADTNGIFYVNGVKHIVKGNQIEGYMLNKTKAGESLIGCASYMIDGEETQTKASSTYTYYTNNAVCHQRKAITQPTVYRTIYYTPNGVAVNRYTLDIFMDARKKSWGAWVHYSTSYAISSILFNGVVYSDMDSGSSTSHTFTIINETSYNVHIFSYKYATRGTIEHGYTFYDKNNNNESVVLPNANDC